MLSSLIFLFFLPAGAQRNLLKHNQGFLFLEDFQIDIRHLLQFQPVTLAAFAHEDLLSLSVGQVLASGEPTEDQSTKDDSH